MSISDLQIQEFINFFSGSKHNFGEFLPNRTKTGEKVEGRYRTVTNKLITIEDYRAHLEGKKGLGLIPISEEGKCKFFVIDVDVYGASLDLYIEAIERGGFPLVPFKSKSGGLHIYMFLKEGVKVRSAVELMRKFVFLLSIDSLMRDNKKKGTVEIFPKQSQIGSDDSGSFINLPYYNSHNTKQHAIKKGKSLSLNEALVYLKKKATTLSDAEFFLKEIRYSDAPPCLQLLYILNPFENDSGRNNFLFSFGVYLKKKDEDFFESNLQEINQGLQNPLPEKEVERTILSSLRKKDYIYKCKENPCIDFCHTRECKRREYGIGKNEGYFSSVEVGKLYQFKTAQPYYEWEVRLQGQEDFKRLRFRSEDEIIKQDAFLRLCMRELHELPSKLKQAEWFNKVNQALKELNAISVDDDDDTSPIIMLKSLILEFVTGRAKAETKDQILAKRVYFEESKKEYLFRVQDLIDFLYVQKKFRYFNPQEVHGILRELKCGKRKLTTESRKQIRVATFSQDDLEVYDGKGMFTPDFTQFTEEEDF